MQPKPITVALFDVGPCLQALCQKYNMQQPFNSHQYMVVNLWLAQAIERIFIVHVTPHPAIYDNSPLQPSDLTLIADSTLDPILTQTVRFNNMNTCSEVGGLQMRSRLSANSLIVEM